MGFTNIPAVGKLRAAVLSALITELRPISATKPIDETIISNATLQNDDDLFVAVAASTTYDFQLMMLHNSGVTPKLKFGWTFPVGTTMRYGFMGYAGGVQSFRAIETDVAVLDGNASSLMCLCIGTLITSTTAGTLQLQWAQSVLTASNTSVLTGSFLELRKRI
jgi:hypothetical protein